MGWLDGIGVVEFMILVFMVLFMFRQCAHPARTLELDRNELLRTVVRATRCLCVRM
jgi:hypothetical protein